jgi:hypothetical protein
MMPYRAADRFFTYITAVAGKLNSFIGIKYLVESSNMPFVSFAQPTWPSLQE